MSSTDFTLRLDDTLALRLDALTKKTHRTTAELLLQAVERFVEDAEDDLARTEHAIAQADAGQAVPAEEVRAWLLSNGYLTLEGHQEGREALESAFPPHRQPACSSNGRRWPLPSSGASTSRMRSMMHRRLSAS